MRTLSTAVQNKIAIKLGTEPVNILEVQWGNENSGWAKYADKDIKNYEFPVAGKIISISDLESVIKLDNQGQTQGLNVILSDTSGDLKNIFDNNDLHGKRCILYQWFEGLPLSERFQLYEGEIISPIFWSEGDRTLEFDVVTKLADVEIGFSPEEGKFPYLPDEIVGKPWPLVFGKVQNVPATLLSEIPYSQIIEAIGVPDPTIAERLSELATQKEWMHSIWYLYILAAGQAALSATGAKFNAETAETLEEARYWEQEYKKFKQYQEQFETQATSALSQYYEILNEINSLTDTLDDQKDNSPNQINLANASAFPQNTQLELSISGLEVTGTVSGNVLTITNITDPTYTGYEGEPHGFTYIPPGVVARITSIAPIIYIVSITPVTIHHIQAYKNSLLVAVPESYYTVVTETMGPYTVTYLKLDKALSSYDEEMGDDIYVTMTSTIGPNTIDILEWLISTYTSFSIDTTSFTNVKSYLENYPSHFALLERKNIITVLEEIAFQARCAIWIVNNTIYIKYLSEASSPVTTLTESDIDAGSLRIYTTTTEELVTKLTAEWTDNYALTEKHSIILRNNGARYGIRERTIDFYIYNIAELVVKSATFWLIRLSNVWKHLEFTAYMEQLAIETFDTVKFNFSTAYIASSAVDCDITKAVYNLSDQTISMSAISPVRCGEMEEYEFFRPKAISVNLVYPTDEEIINGDAGSGGIGEDVEGSIEVYEEFDRGGVSFYSINKRIEDEGYNFLRRFYRTEQRPTDVDDTKPEPNFSATTIRESDTPSYDYSYKVYEVEEVEPYEESIPPDISSVFPGQVVNQVADDIYNVDVYTMGLSNDPVMLEVKQLQIDETATIPAETWLLVAYNRWTDEEGETHSEYTMQVPIWL